VLFAQKTQRTVSFSNVCIPYFHTWFRYWTKKRRRIAVGITAACVTGVVLALVILIPILVTQSKGTNIVDLLTWWTLYYVSMIKSFPFLQWFQNVFFYKFCAPLLRQTVIDSPRLNWFRLLSWVCHYHEVTMHSAS
jgi:hypothetical protein